MTPAFQAAPESEGSLNDTPCAWIADADPRLGPVLEVFVNGTLHVGAVRAIAQS